MASSVGSQMSLLRTVPRSWLTAQDTQSREMASTCPYPCLAERLAADQLGTKLTQTAVVRGGLSHSPLSQAPSVNCRAGAPGFWKPTQNLGPTVGRQPGAGAALGLSALLASLVPRASSQPDLAERRYEIFPVAWH